MLRMNEFMKANWRGKMENGRAQRRGQRGRGRDRGSGRNWDENRKRMEEEDPRDEKSSNTFVEETESSRNQMREETRC